MTMEIAGETRSDARVASEGPRATVNKTPPCLTPSLAQPNDREGQALALR